MCTSELQLINVFNVLNLFLQPSATFEIPLVMATGDRLNRFSLYSVVIYRTNLLEVK